MLRRNPLVDRKPFCSILHLSDTHLGARFEDAGGKNRKFFTALRKDQSYVMQAHDPTLLLLLPLEFKKIACFNQTRFKKAWPDQPAPSFFDKVIVSGDISTDATDKERFEFAHKFLTSEMQLNIGLYSKDSSVGLNIPNELLLSLPGNHDKMRQTTLEMFNNAFKHSPSPANYIQAFRRFGHTVIFLVMDSNAYNEGNIAKGEIDFARLSWLIKTLSSLESGIVIDQQRYSPEECRQAIKCLVLHHHVCDLSFKKRFFSIGRNFTKMVGADDLLRTISGRIHVIFHGHEHYPIHFIEEQSGAIVISAGSTSQWHQKVKKNSFYHVTFFTDHAIQIDEYVWTGTGFVTRQQINYTKELAIYALPKFDVALAG